jgi:EmrB/QacA subfamily drug resistance transporter
MSRTQQWLILLAMTGAQAMTMLDKSVVSVTLPTLATDLSLGPVAMQWVVNGYMLAMAAFVAVGGRLAEVHGEVPTFRVGMIVFALASVGCAFAPHGTGAAWIITFRAVQGLGAALMMPVSAAIVLNTFVAAEAGMAMAVYTGIAQLFQAMGPLVGGALTEYVSWRAVFWINVPIAVTALILTHMGKPASLRIPGARVSVRAAALLVAGCASIIGALQQGPAWGWMSPWTLAGAAVGVLLLVQFVRDDLRSASPLIDLRLLANRAILADFMLAFVIQFATLAAILFGALYLQDVLHMKPFLAGVAMLPFILAQAIGGQVGGNWFDHVGIRRPALVGFATASVGLAAWAIGMPQTNYWDMVAGMALTGLGLGLALSPSSTDGISRAGAAERGEASGLLQTVRQLGTCFGVAVIGAVVLGANPNGSRDPSTAESAHALAWGFGATALVVAITLVLAARFMPPRQPKAALPSATSVK